MHNRIVAWEVLEVIDFYKVFLNESTVSVVDAVVKTELVNSAADPRVRSGTHFPASQRS